MQILIENLGIDVLKQVTVSGQFFFFWGGGRNIPVCTRLLFSNVHHHSTMAAVIFRVYLWQGPSTIFRLAQDCCFLMYIIILLWLLPYSGSIYGNTLRGLGLGLQVKKGIKLINQCKMIFFFLKEILKFKIYFMKYFNKIKF